MYIYIYIGDIINFVDEERFEYETIIITQEDKENRKMRKRNVPIHNYTMSDESQEIQDQNEELSTGYVY
jgi:hypothetical protein